MLEPPEHVRLRVPEEPFFPGESPVWVRVRSPEAVSRVAEAYGQRLLGFEIDDRTLRVPEDVLAFRDRRLILRLEDQSLLERTEVVDALRPIRPIVSLRPGEAFLRTVNYLASLGFYLVVEPDLAPTSEEGLLQVAEFYLHNPLLSAPIEPFHAALLTASNTRQATLWEVYREAANGWCFVSDDGRVAPSERWIERDAAYGSVGDGWEDIAGSELHSRLLDFQLELFRAKSACTTCAQFDVCAGFLRALDVDWPCEPWQKCFQRVREEASRARELLQERAQQD